MTSDGILASSVSAANVGATGAQSVTVVGLGGSGHWAFSATGRLGASTSTASLWISDSSLKCRSAMMVAVGRTLSATSGQQVGTLLAALTAAGPGPSSAVPVNVAATGAMSVTVVAASTMGVADYTSQSRLGGSRSEASPWTSTTSLRMLVMAAVEPSGRVVATMATQAGSISAIVTIDGPSVSSVQRSNLAATGAASVTVVGSGAGAVRYSASVRIGGSRVEATTWVSSSAMQLRSATGLLVARTVVSTSSVFTGSLASAMTHDGVSLSSVVFTNAAVTGSQSVTVVGLSSAGQSAPWYLPCGCRRAQSMLASPLACRLCAAPWRRSVSRPVPYRLL
jgi:hypothetical protein